VSSYTDQWFQVVEEYRAAGGPWPFKKTEVAEWALAHHRWKPSHADIRRMCADSLADAMREVNFTDEAGRVVRRMLPAKTTRGGEQGTFWDDLRTAPIDHVRIGIAQRRNGIAAECYHLNNMARYSNEHRGPKDQIELILDFTNDVREMDQPIEQGTDQPAKLKLVTSTPSSTGRPPQSGRPRPARPGSVSRRGTSRPSYRPSGP
jgi:hypothetical protein